MSQLKKLINELVEELVSLGLSPIVLQQLKNTVTKSSHDGILSQL